jgi:hypothetical protein
MNAILDEIKFILQSKYKTGIFLDTAYKNLCKVLPDYAKHCGGA